ncbi:MULTISPECIES: c-type cytochrome [unclassified Rhizobium]|uniref:c-type cytochrome n=1 Tax=unclassified Rhizobium TaxID=2613769 RepID=UPI000EAAA51D|nr:MULTISPECIES: c-type cytochrome [unclassified Rhizobium]AYG64634.1 cytochrome C [Rhizobium sp. CCGE531]AYG71116.1 cytochrome C [Rhizobium sp. CCGE532]
MNLSKRHLAIGAAFVSALIVTGLGIAAWIVYEPALSEIARPSPSSFDRGLVAKGEQLATVGDCIVCHTAPNGAPFAGARALPTPFGTLFSDNITPDEKTGIGAWSLPAFSRAMRQGVARDGSHLYPALPYEHFTHVSDDDLEAIYAFLMTRQPVSQPAPENQLLPGLGFRPLLAGWKLLFLQQTAFEPQANESAEWNRGKYLADGLAHCGGCHTPRNLAGGEERGREFAGGVAEGWNAPALDETNPSAASWNADSLFAYLKTGSDRGHSAAGGPMGPVAEGLSRLNDADVRAIAVYIASQMHPAREASPSVAAVETASDNRSTAAATHPEADLLFEGACSGCHAPRAPMNIIGRPLLSTASDLRADDPRNAVQTLLQGIVPPGEKGAYMPSFSSSMTDRQLTDLLAYARARFTDKPAWPNLEATVGDIRKENAQ